MAHSNFRNTIVTIAFLIVISFPFINGKLTIIKDIENTENRQPAAKPYFDILQLDNFPSKYDNYFSDNFTVRQRLIKYYNQLNLVLFKKSPLPDQIIIGNDDWLFSGGKEIETYRGKNRFKKSEMEQIRLELEYRKKYLEDRNCKFYFLIAPVKQNIYSENVPISVYRYNKQSWGEQLIEYLNKHSVVKPINAYKTLRESKKYGLLYYKLDNHWNQRGAFFAVNDALKQMNKDIPTVEGLSYSNYIADKTISHGGNIASMLSNTQMFTDSVFELYPQKGFTAVEVKKVGYPVDSGFAYPTEFETVQEIPNSHKPKILIISDSFGGNAFPFLSESFRRSVKIFDAWQYKLNENIVNSEKPDVVLLIVLESNIRNILRFQSRLRKNDSNKQIK